ncbi:MAG: phosphatase PAP2 family protein [Thermoflavifilum sp.]|nr:phosphatase PAP2 family protein [Thermoflavifilum sp.]
MAQDSSIITVRQPLFQQSFASTTISQQPRRYVSFDRPWIKDVAVPSILIGDGLATYGHHEFLFSSAALQEGIIKNYPHFHTSIDNYLQYLPTAGTFALRFTHMQSAHSFREQLILFVTTTILQGIVVTGLKYTVREPRPDGSNDLSFPSGHTTTAFGGAMLLYEEYHLSTPHWVAYSGFPIAAATGALRLYNNKHWYSDVAVGAGLGILCTEAAYQLVPVFDRRLKLQLKTQQAIHAHSTTPLWDDSPYAFLSRSARAEQQH